MRRKLLYGAISILLILLILSLSLGYYYSYQRANNLEEELDTIINSCNQTIHQLQGTITKLNNKNENLTSRVYNLENRYNVLKEEKEITRATKSEVVNFIGQDKTDEKEWTKEYDCSSFGADVVSHALERGILAYTVELEFEDGGHIIVCFPLRNEEELFIEPQGDKIIRGLETGKDWCEVANWDCDNRIIEGIVYP